MNLRYEILKACAANPGAPMVEICARLKVLEVPGLDADVRPYLTDLHAHAVSVNGQFVGVAVIDILVVKLEQLIAPCLGATKVLLTNLENRVIVSNVSQIRTGSIYQAAANTAAVATIAEHFKLYAL